MLCLISDENVTGHIVAGLLRRQCPDLDLVRAQDVGLMNTPDPDILEWAAREGRIVLTDDAATMIDFAWERVRQGLPMPGLFVLRDRGSISDVIDTILFAAENSTPDDWQNLVTFVPF